MRFLTSILEADLLILLSDIDGMYTDDPNKNPEARFISQVDDIDEKLENMGKASSGSGVGTGGMAAKIAAAKIATASGADMVITNGNICAIKLGSAGPKPAGLLYLTISNITKFSSSTNILNASSV